MMAFLRQQLWPFLVSTLSKSCGECMYTDEKMTIVYNYVLDTLI